NSLVSHIRSRVGCLQMVGADVLCDVWLAYSPYLNTQISQTSDLILRILTFEYGSTVIDALAHDPLSPDAVDRENRWPELVPNSTVLACQAAYFEGTQWKPDPVCAVCGQHMED
ncbi:hypothetical protein P692DRAFT_20677368, partial [Suillus brevipes Sb2]